MDTELTSRFLGWQCRIRQHAVRKQEGRPPPGSCASVKLGGKSVAQINTVINKLEPQNVTAEFRFMVQKTADPETIYQNALKYLSEYYYQYPDSFHHRLMALFNLDSELADQIIAAEQCELGFFQGNQHYTLQCKAELFDPSSEVYQATYWHNHLFNANMPGVVKVIGFNVDWAASAAEEA
jgi:hypothetical protein